MTTTALTATPAAICRNPEHVNHWYTIESTLGCRYGGTDPAAAAHALAALPDDDHTEGYAVATATLTDGDPAWCPMASNAVENLAMNARFAR